MTNASAPDSKKRDAPAFDFYPERWTHGTRHLSKVERCDFLDLLAVQWTEDGIVDDLPRIARMLGYRRAEQIPAAVLEKFPVAADGKRRHPFLEKLRAEQRERIRTNSERQRDRAMKRWGRDQGSAKDLSQRSQEAKEQRKSETTSASDAVALPRQCPPPTTHHPPLNNILSGGGSNAQAREPSGSAALRCRSVAGDTPDPPPTPHPAGKDAGAPSSGASPSAILNPKSEILNAPFPTQPEVQNHGTTIGADPACCEAFWQECEAVHWVNKHGVPIADWRPLLARFRTRWNAIDFQNRASAANAPPGSTRAPSRFSPASNPNRTRSHHAHANPSRNPSSITGELNRPGRYASSVP